MRGRAIAILLAATSCLAATAVWSDTRITSREGMGVAGDASELPEAMRQSLAEREPETVTYWMAGDRMARIAESGKMVGRLDRGETYIVDDQERTYHVLRHDELGGGDATGNGAELQRSDETRRVGRWDTVRYDLTVGEGDDQMRAVLWVSDEVDIDRADYAAYLEFFTAQGMDWMRSVLELEGYPVRQEVEVGPLSSWQEVIEVRRESAPPGTYEVPSGYRLLD